MPQTFNFMNESVDVAGVGTPQEKVIRRYTNPAPTMPAATPASTPAAPQPQAPANPVADYYTGLNRTAPTAEDEAMIRENTRKGMQAQIDAINAQYATLISNEAAQQDKLAQNSAGQVRATSARSGLMGSDFGNAFMQNDAQNSARTKSAALAVLENEKNVKVQQILGNIEARASEEIKARKAEALGNQEKYVQYLAQTQEQARNDLKTLAQSGMSLDQLNPAQKEAILKQSGYEPGMAELIYNSFKPKPSQIDYKFEKLADGQGLFYGVDPLTGQLKTQHVKVDVPDGFSMTIAPDGTPLIFNKTTGEARVAGGFGEGQFQKPEDQLDIQKKRLEIIQLQNSINGRGDLLPTERDRAAFNQIVSKYNASPLIAAADRTIVLKNTVDAVKGDPGNAALQLNLAYGYIQALDTYQSAVREGELSNVNSIDSKIGQLQNYIQQMTNGQTVRPEVAQQIAGAAETLINYINEGAKQKEQVFESQARVNGIEEAWNNFREGFSTNYDSPKIQLNPITGPVSPLASPLLKKYPYQEVGQFIKQYPDATEAEIRELVGVTSGDKGGISSASPIAAVAKKYPAGYKGGQCGDFAHKIVDFPSVGDSKSQKIASVNRFGIPAAKWRGDVRVGDVIITGENPTYGHVAVVNEILPDGRIKLTESNFKQSEKVSHDRVIAASSPQIYGAIRGKLKLNTLA
jgi:hypothetical protein